MSPLDLALAYVGTFGWPVFARPRGGWAKEGWHAATTDEPTIRKMWERWPTALIATPTGHPSGLIVLDIDMKGGKNGWAELDRLGHLMLYPLSETPIAFTPNAGNHAYFRINPDHPIRWTVGELAPGLDVLSDGTSVALPTPGYRYTWDSRRKPSQTKFATAPEWLAVAKPEPPKHPKPIQPAIGLSPYADGAIARACSRIRYAPDGQQHMTLAKESFSIGTLAGAGGIPPAFARAALIDAGLGMTAYKKRRWDEKTITRTVNDCFDAGMDHPRPNR